MIIEYYKRYKSVISYLFFGVLTTIVNIVTYNLLYYKFGVTNVVSNIVAWVLAVLFAYITNKLYVFNSKSWEIDYLLREIALFFSARLLTGIIDTAIMYMVVDLMNQEAFVWKLLTNVIVVVLNYLASKFIIFKDRDKEKDKEKDKDKDIDIDIDTNS